MTAENVAAVLALVSSPDAEVVEADVPVPPLGSSPAATALWYALIDAYEFNLGEMAILEQVVTTKSHMDEVEADWRRDGSPMTALGSMQQSVTEPRLQELRQMRSQYASLIKQLNLPADGGQEKRRPGRPTRAEGGGQWGKSR